MSGDTSAGGKGRLDEEKMKKDTAGRLREDGKRGVKKGRVESERGGWPEAGGRGDQCSREGETLDSL